MNYKEKKGTKYIKKETKTTKKKNIYEITQLTLYPM